MATTERMAARAYRNFYGEGPPGPLALDTWVRVVSSVCEAIAGERAELQWLPYDLDLQDTAGISAVYIVPDTEETEPCLVAETVGGPKPYMRIWPRMPEAGVEWAWVLHRTACPLWTMSASRTGGTTT
ncbi:MAG: hypothetical protein J2P17_33390 [Mycobacterium sp.]|nr:hypothetical protein [Mycobacterium sp.]